MITRKQYEQLLNNLSGDDLGTFLKNSDPGFFQSLFFDFWLSLKPKEIHYSNPNTRVMGKYQDDPRLIKAKFDSRCRTCKCNIPKGVNCYYWPRGKRIYCLSCGDADYKAFLSSAADEDVYHGRGNPYYG